MTRPSTPPILSELRNASSPASQVAALRALKNEIIGHEQKKEMWIGLGVLAPIARILSAQAGNGKKRSRDVNGGGAQLKRKTGRVDEEEARLQAIIIVGSLAHGGPAYISPLNAGLVIGPLLAALSLAEFSPHMVLATLRTLNFIADSLSLEHVSVETNEDSLPALLYTEQHLTSITQLLSQGSPSATVQQHIWLAATLITKTCREESQRKLLAQTGVLEALAIRLSSFVLGKECSIVSDNGAIRNWASQDAVSTSTASSKLAPILEAIGTIIQNSKLRAIQFLSAPCFVAVTSRIEMDVVSNHERKANGWNLFPCNPPAHRNTSSNPIETLLPRVPSFHHRVPTAQATNLVPLGIGATSEKPMQTYRTFRDALEVIQSHSNDSTESDENPLISWLIYVARGEGGMTRLMAAWVLAMFYRFGLTHRRRETGLAFLIVPLLVRMLDKDSKISPMIKDPYGISPLRRSEWIIKEQAPAVLAMLAVDSYELQRAAVDAGAIKKLSQLLKESYDPLPAGSSSSLWAPHSTNQDHRDPKGSSSKLGDCGISPVAYHITRMREAVLIALAALASLKDEYRKAIIDNGVVPFVIESLKPSSMASFSSGHPRKSGDETARDRKPLTGDSSAVILAACGAAKFLSRSVSTLRTSLMDAGLAAPLFILLKNPKVDIQIAATAVICNLVLEFSPMREAIIDAGILKILCEHAHSANVNLRLNSVWALKHLVLTAPNSLKMDCLTELGPGWLKQIISNGTENSNSVTGSHRDRDAGYGAPIAMGTPNAAGEQVDLLNAVEEESRDATQFLGDGPDDVKMMDNIGAVDRPDPDRRRSSQLPRSDQTRAGSLGTTQITSVKDAEVELMQHACNDDLAVQKEGLDFIRNLICGPGAFEMIDYIFRDLGQDKIFDMLAGKLRPRVLNAFNRDKRPAVENGVKHLQPQPDIIVSVCYIIVHIAAGRPRHRQMLISQSELLKLIVPLFNHSKWEVRACCAWLVINLTFPDDQSDHANCKARARELVNLGVYQKLETLEADPELDVRERTKTAIHQMRELLR